MTQERLQKFLARAGVASRRAAEELISAGRVKVNGAVISALGSRVDTEKDTVTVDGKPTRVASAHTYLLLNKPPGVLTTLSDPQGRPTVKSLLRGITARVFPVGRLDFDAEGALILTDDGELAQRLTHPKYQVPRTYLALVKGVPTDADLNRLLTGVRLEDGPAQAAVAERFEKVGDETWVKLVVHEGRQHLVKKLCAAIGFPVTRLFRPMHAGVALGTLPPGQFRKLSEEEVKSVVRVSSAGGVPAVDAPAAAALVLPGPRVEHKAPLGSESKPASRSEFRSPPRSESKSASRNEFGSSPRSESRPASRTEFKSPPRSESVPASRSGYGGSSRSESKPASRSGYEGSSRTESKPVSRSGHKGPPRSESKPASRNEFRSPPRGGFSAPGRRTESKPPKRR